MDKNIIRNKVQIPFNNLTQIVAGLQNSHTDILDELQQPYNQQTLFENKAKHLISDLP